MFFFGIFGIQDKTKQVKEFSNIVCSCGRLSRLQLIEHFMYFHFFFVPLFKWGRKYYVEARCCGSVWEVPQDYIDELIKNDSVEINKLKEIRTPFRVCTGCRQYVDPDYRFCPHCGKEM